MRVKFSNSGEGTVIVVRGSLGKVFPYEEGERVVLNGDWGKLGFDKTNRVLFLRDNGQQIPINRNNFLSLWSADEEHLTRVD